MAPWPSSYKYEALAQDGAELSQPIPLEDMARTSRSLSEKDVDSDVKQATGVAVSTREVDTGAQLSLSGEIDVEEALRVR